MFCSSPSDLLWIMEEVSSLGRLFRAQIEVWPQHESLVCTVYMVATIAHLTARHEVAGASM